MASLTDSGPSARYQYRSCLVGYKQKKLKTLVQRFLKWVTRNPKVPIKILKGSMSKLNVRYQLKNTKQPSSTYCIIRDVSLFNWHGRLG